MSVYHHVANKGVILDGMVGLVFSQIDDAVQAQNDWRALRQRAHCARSVLRRHHPWAIGLLESRTSPGTATLRHHEAVLGTLRGAGFSVEMSGHVYALLDSYIYGFALQEASLPFAGPDTVADVADSILHMLPEDDYPHLVELTTQYVLRPGYDFGDELEFATLLLDGLAASLPLAASHGSA